MERAYAKRSRLLEFLLAAAVIAVLAGFWLAALLRFEEAAEKAVVEATVRNIDSGLRFAQAQLVVAQRENERAGFLERNPVGWLANPPAGYAGEVDRVEPAQLARGQWLWERSTGHLYYRPWRTAALRVAGDGDWLAWRVAAADGGFRGVLRVQAVRAYEWTP